MKGENLLVCFFPALLWAINTRLTHSFFWRYLLWLALIIVTLLPESVPLGKMSISMPVAFLCNAQRNENKIMRTYFAILNLYPRWPGAWQTFCGWLVSVKTLPVIQLRRPRYHEHEELPFDCGSPSFSYAKKRDQPCGNWNDLLAFLWRPTAIYSTCPE